ncbi:hypothetical protein FZEAL_6452 [Fusarium zealandicum]|uniref:NmrA-like domain-containing protein n=1 Tax=Fusarium zealandicum TaxID=1053134 RepID=A0A8H4UIJ3_9HYPO|nr:hypothetical protein FZEAL_6452 [Fusarium zealandicum]
MKVAIAGATGEIGRSIVDGLMNSSADFEITALVRPSSIDKPEVKKIKSQGVSTVSIDLLGPREELVKALSDQDVVICAVGFYLTQEQYLLAEAAKDAGVKRFVPNTFGPSCPPAGVMLIREMKEEIINHIKKMYLPYTVIDVGLWYQITLPRLPSGKIDNALAFPSSQVSGDGHSPSSLTDLRDVGKYVARIIADDRTLNKYVFAHNEEWTQEQVYSQLEKVSGEKVPRNVVSQKEVEAAIAAGQAAYESDKSMQGLTGLVYPQYLNCEWVRGDNLPGRAKYLGYLDTKELYPDFEHVRFEDYVHEVVQGRAVPVYADRSMPTVPAADKSA